MTANIVAKHKNLTSDVEHQKDTMNQFRSSLAQQLQKIHADTTVFDD